MAKMTEHGWARRSGIFYLVDLKGILFSILSQACHMRAVNLPGVFQP
ncbi:MAG: hypothetical protein LBP52_08960 [Burkholderiaceae bacterium]|jgi:hypothetical protein|nr:hypothetical protein [Burkholderiaceae bacterium]